MRHRWGKQKKKIKGGRDDIKSEREEKKLSKARIINMEIADNIYAAHIKNYLVSRDFPTDQNYFPLNYDLLIHNCFPLFSVLRCIILFPPPSFRSVFQILAPVFSCSYYAMFFACSKNFF